MNLSIFNVFLKNRNFTSKIKRTKVTDYAALSDGIGFQADISDGTQHDLLVCFDSLRPINNLSVKQGRVFLG